MPVTVANEDSVVVLDSMEEAALSAGRFNWSAVFAGTSVAIAAIFFLLTLGSGIGLSLVTARGVASPQFFTLGAIYFLAAQAFGLAIGAHITGRLIGPKLETAPEEEFRAAAHGLVVWGLAAIATAAIVMISGWVAAGSAANLAALSGGANATMNSVAPNVAAYWTDMLFRPSAADQHAGLQWLRYAQADTGAQTDADQPSAQDQPQAQPMQAVPNNAPEPNNAVPSSQSPTAPATPGPTASERPQTTAPQKSPLIEIPQHSPLQSDETVETAPPPSGARNITADKAEVARILEVGMANGGVLSSYDRQRIANLIAADTDVGIEQAVRRIDDAVTTIHQNEVRDSEFALKSVRNASLWIAFALLFGAIVAAMAAVSARWADDAVTFGRSRREPV